MCAGSGQEEQGQREVQEEGGEIIWRGRVGDEWKRKQDVEERKVKSTKRGRRGPKDCVFVYSDEICHPQQPPVKRNRISSPQGGNLQMKDCGTGPSPGLQNAFNHIPHLPTHIRTHTRLHTHTPFHSHFSL